MKLLTCRSFPHRTARPVRNKRRRPASGVRRALHPGARGTHSAGPTALFIALQPRVQRETSAKRVAERVHCGDCVNAAGTEKKKKRTLIMHAALGGGRWTACRRRRNLWSRSAVLQENVGGTR
ncbi:hypothetical protein EYF80_060844 [Liparis tanakae]|uniref:Uncharacterized protein n=1 Tax=Liparis tanakae TaxID=230148 RepID=A0A4Z2EJR4_9TELE|nr:hypothetical protein EYF80_060844 [Liparis tanakae]